MSVADKIMNLGDDSFTNIFELDLQFPLVISGDVDAASISLRIDQALDIPEDAVSTYDIFYQGIKITKTNKQEETSKEFTTQVRLDSKWKVYDDLKLWKNLTFNPINGLSVPDLTSRGSLLIKPLDNRHGIIKTLKLTLAKLKSLKVTSFDPNTSDPHRLELSFIFQTMEEL